MMRPAMNLILLFSEDFLAAGRVRLTGRRLAHVASVHCAAVGRELVVGEAGGKLGLGVITRLDQQALEMDVLFDTAPPPPLALNLILALPRPKVLNRVIASVTSLGIKRIDLINAWKVEKSYWQSPRLSEENLVLQQILGLEQARDTILPVIRVHRFFRAFVEEALPALAAGTLALAAHPGAGRECPRQVSGPVSLAVGPEGGFIDAELEALERAGFLAVSIGERALRVETAVAALVARLT